MEDQALLWLVFAFATGISVYFLLPAQPNLWVVSAGFLFLTAGVLRAYGSGHAMRAGFLAWAVLAGVFCAGLRTYLVEAPRLSAARTVTATGMVADRQATRRGLRLLVDVEAFSGPGTTVLQKSVPMRIRVSVPGDTTSSIGDTITVKARLFPPAGPVRPGGYDFSFRAYFERIGATGFTYGAPQQVDALAVPHRLRFKRSLLDIRQGIGSRIRALLPEDDPAELAVALLVGDRSGISEYAEETLRRAGLAHVLAISGLHMALFAGGAYAVFLMLLSLSETATLKWRNHKIAALAALGAATGYLALSGASVATQRSFIMIGLVFIAILAGRRGLTLRSVALAGLVLLSIAPERLFSPGFQMSFAAVICLVAVYAFWRQHSSTSEFRFGAGNQHTGLVSRSLRFIGPWIGGLFVTALVAGTATGIIGAYHFGRIAPLGLIGNMLGMPVFSLVIMPMGVLALVLMPLGLAAAPLHAMTTGLDVLLKIAAWTADLAPGSGVVATPGALVTLALVVGLFVLLLLPGRYRVLSALPFGVAVLGLLLFRPPDIQIAGKGRLIATRDNAGILRIDAKRSGFAAEIWLQAEGVPQDAFTGHKMQGGQRRCDREGCVYRAFVPRSAGALSSWFGRLSSKAQEPSVHAARPILVAASRKPGALIQDCRRADIIVTDLEVPTGCAAGLIFGAKARDRLGAISIWLTSEKGRVVVTRWSGAKSTPPRPWHK